MKNAFTKGTLVLAAGLAVAGTAPAQQVFTTQAQGTGPEGSLNGMQALRQLDTRLADIAKNHNMTEADLATLLRTDLSTYVTPDGRVFNVCPLADEHQQDPSGPDLALLGGDIPLDDFLSLESVPGADKTIYLDFDGHLSVNDGWGHNINFPAWDRSGNTGVFTDSEKQEIIDTWLEVAEDFVQFNINVTTQDPGLAALTKSNGSDSTYGIRVVMTQATSGFGNGIGGVAFLNTFDASGDTPCFGFNKGLNAGPQTASHEAGHTFGLQHDGLDGSTYHPGSSGGSPTWGPIMGAPFGRQLVQFSNGDYPGFTSTQNDFGVITNGANDVDYFPDDHSDSLTGGTPLLPDTPVTGVISTRTDTDAFSFTAFGGDVTINVNAPDVGENIDLKFQLYRDTPFTLVDDFSPTGTYNASKTYNALPAGNYTVVVDGTYETKTNGPVSDYGSTGSYTIDMSQSVLLLNISLLTTPPTLIAPDTTTPISVLIEENDDTLVGTPTLSYQRAGDGSPTTINLTGGAGGVYSGALPGFDCGDDPTYWVSAEGATAGVVSDPSSGGFNALIGTGVSVIDDSETDLGWTVTGSATEGQWTRGVPQNNDRSDPPADFDGSGQAWQTGLEPGDTNSDIDGGDTVMTSPAFDFSEGGTVSYAYWMNDETNTIGAEDYFRVEVSTNNGASWTVARSYSPASSWRTDTIDIGAEFGNTSELRIRFAAADNDPGDVLECAVDAIDFESFGCEQTNDCLADVNGDGAVTPTDFTAWVNAFNNNLPECDQNGDGMCTPTDFTAWVNNFNAGCP
ncbi:MAG: hypothetical protein ED559_00010 [Phycisphaera sp.]|nr:MAG: hypothetical protein ED559_00010 [Phycisphaera sp.]